MTAARKKTIRAPARAAAHLTIGVRSVPLEADRIHVIGSGDRADVRLVHASVAPAHATLCAHDGRLILQDLAAPGGTAVDGVPVVGEREIPSGAAVTIGAVRFVVELGPPKPVVVAHPYPEPSFGELMADELRHAPWLGLSILLHAVLFVALYLLMPDEQRIERGTARIAIARSDANAVEDVDGPEEAPEIVVPDPPNPADQLPDEPIDAIEPEPADAAEPFEAPPSPMRGMVDPGVSLFARIGGGADGDVLRAAGGGGKGLSAGFKRTVSGLRETGLEIVFAVDSTGSMGPVLDATRRRMVRMLEALHALVPDARIGIVAYRDRGPGEAYLTRGIGLDRDLYRSLNFMQTVAAAGGGDRPEALLEALQTAVDQQWRQGAKRVIVVIGDAPAHRWSEDDIDRLVARFVRDGRGFVHTITTSTDLFGSISDDTRKSFERIARVGRGQCVPSEREDAILRQVLSLAIGTEFRESIDEVFRILEEREPRCSARARDAVRRADPEAILTELARPTVEDGFVDQMVASRDRAVADALIEALRNADLPAPGRNAAAHALQQMLGLREPPIDPVDPRPIDVRTARDLRNAAANLR